MADSLGYDDFASAMERLIENEYGISKGRVWITPTVTDSYESAIKQATRMMKGDI